MAHNTHAHAFSILISATHWVHDNFVKEKMDQFNKLKQKLQLQIISSIYINKRISIFETTLIIFGQTLKNRKYSDIKFHTNAYIELDHGSSRNWDEPLLQFSAIFRLRPTRSRAASMCVMKFPRSLRSLVNCMHTCSLPSTVRPQVVKWPRKFVIAGLFISVAGAPYTNSI